MRITRLTLANWRNFKNADFALQQRLFVYGPNASGKSNLLDAVRFLRDLTVDGGGFQQAIKDRGGMSRVRNLAARNFNKGRVTVAVAVGDDDQPKRWEYEVRFTAETRGKRRPIVERETVKRDGTVVLDRPNPDDNTDGERLTQTAIEQVVANREFRELAEFISSTRYLHLVPHIIRDPARGSDRAEDPFGGDFLSRVAFTPARERERRLKAINAALQLAVPQLDSLELVTEADRLPHLQARYKHWRTTGARQNEADFSDGTLRLIGLLWSLQDTAKKGLGGPVLLEEPELSLHADIVRQLPTLIAKARKRSGRQVLVTTHAADLLGDPGLGLDEVLVLTPSDEGTTASLAADLPHVSEMVSSGLSLQEALAEDLRQANVERLSLIDI